MKTPERQISIIGQSPSFQPTSDTSQFFNELSGSLEATARDMQAKADSIYVNEFLSSASKSAQQIYNDNKDNPDQLQKLLTDNKEGLLSKTPAKLGQRLQYEYDSIASQYVGKATEQKNKQLALEERLSANERYNTILNDVGFAAKNLYTMEEGATEEEVVARRLNALNSITAGIDSIEKHLVQPDSRGNLRSQAEIVSKVNKAKEYIFSQAAISYYEAAPNKLEALKNWQDGNVSIDSPEGSVNLRNTMDPFVAQNVEDNLLKFYREQQSVIREAKKQQEGIATQYKDLLLATQAIEGQIVLDPTNKDDKTSINAAWEQMQNQMLNEGRSINDILGAAADLTVSTGIIPKTIEGTLTANVINGDTDQKIFYSDYIAKINRENPRALQNIDNDTTALAISITNNLDAGLDPERAVTWAQADIDKAKKEERTFRKSKWTNKKENNKSIEILTDTLQDQPGFDFFREDPAIPDSLYVEYQRLEQGYFVNEGVDRQAARDLATAKIRETYATTNIGPKRIMKYAPEALYGNAAGTDWIEEQLVEKTGLKAGDVALEINPDTVTSDKPSYFITKINEFGAFDILLDENNMPVPFTPNFATTRQAKELEEEIASKQVTRDEAREKIEEQKRIDEIFSNVYF